MADFEVGWEELAREKPYIFLGSIHILYRIDTKRGTQGYGCAEEGCWSIRFGNHTKK